MGIKVVREAVERLSAIPSTSEKRVAAGRKTAVKWILAVAVVAMIPYLNVLRGGFVLDDWQLIVYSPIVRNLDVHQAFLTRFLPESFGTDILYYRPLVTLSYQANYATAGLNPAVFHLTNLLLNALVAVMVYLLARRLGASYAAAGVAGIAFSVLPSHAEAVAWISGRTDVVSTLFILGSLLVFMANHRREQGFSWPLGVLCAALFTCALLSKESSLTLPILMLGYVVIFGEWKRPREALKWAAVLLPPVVVYLVLRKHVMGTSLDSHMGYLLAERMLGVGVAYASYMRMLFVPQEVRVLYDVFTIVGRSPVVAYLAWLVPLGLIAVAALARKRAPIVSFAAFWVFVTLLPVSNILPTFGPLPAERFVYLASVGSSMVIGMLVLKLYEYRPRAVRTWPVVVVLLTGGYLLYSAAFAVHGSRYYASDLAWANGVVATNTRFAMFRYAAARTYEDNGMLDKAIEQYKTALELKAKEFQPDMRANAQYRLGLCYVKTGLLIEAADAFEQVAVLNPSHGMAWRNYGRAELELGDDAEAARGYEQAFELIKPTSRDHYELGTAYKALGRTRLAERQFKSALDGGADDEWTRKAQRELDSLSGNR